MAGSGIQHSLAGLVTLLPGPALVIDQDKHRVLAHNSSAVETYGDAVEVGAPFHVNCESTDELTYLKLSTDGELKNFIETVQENALFAMYRVSDTIIVLADISTGQAPNRLNISAEDNHYPSYHFSYLHRMMSGHRTFPDPDQLISLGLIEKRDDVSDLDWRTLIIEEDRDAFDQVVGAAMEHGGNHRLRYQIRGLDGRNHEVTDFFSVVREEGKWPVLSGTIVSAEGAEKKMQQIERLCLVGRLVGGMIHDFRNLLGGIQSMMEWCMAQSPEDSPVYEAMEKTIGYTEQASGLIRSTLRLMDGKSEVNDEFIPVKALLDDAEDMIVHFGGTAATVKVECNDMMPPLYGQRSVLLDILLNLGLNACEAMEETGDTLIYRVSLEECRDHYGKMRHHVVIKVIDNGCGMTREQSESIFNEFFTTKKDGAGLGLWMVREGIHSFGGTISLESRLGLGTEFRVAIPVPAIKKQPEPVKSPAKKATPVDAGSFATGKTVLFIEDDPLLRSGVATWLTSMGFNVIAAEDGTVGLECFKEHKDSLDLIIQDFILPGIHGDTLLETFVSEAPHIPVIVCSGYSDGTDQNWILEKGAKAFLAKAFPIEKLIAVIKEVLDSTPVS